MGPGSAGGAGNGGNGVGGALTVLDNPLADAEPDTTPPELKKEGTDWWAIFSPRVPRVLDVNLQLTLTHERSVISDFIVEICD
jgi:glucose repression regulatory protein TUP1